VKSRDFDDVRRDAENIAENVMPFRHRFGSRPHAVGAMTVGFGRKNNIDAILSQNFAPVGSSALVHDAIFAEHPEWFTEMELRYLRMIRMSLKRAEIIFATSKSEMQRIVRVWPETESRIRAVGLSASASVLNSVSTEPHGAFMKKGRFILVVGRLNARKNLARLVSAFLADENISGRFTLVVVGAEDGKAEYASAAHKSDKVVFTGHISDGELKWCYQNCALFVFPSLAEGFGLPLLEAHALGARSVCSDIAVFRELGVAVDYFDPRSVQDIGAALGRALSMVGRDHIEPSLLSWNATVESIRSGLDEQLGRRKH
jgi:glycosyltransferase involved in cell wall biosynthesis